ARAKRNGVSTMGFAIEDMKRDLLTPNATQRPAIRHRARETPPLPGELAAYAAGVFRELGSAAGRYEGTPERGRRPLLASSCACERIQAGCRSHHNGILRSRQEAGAYCRTPRERSALRWSGRSSAGHVIR